jgi:hypothetical protein
MKIIVIDKNKLSDILGNLSENVKNLILEKTLKKTGGEIIKKAEDKVWNHQRTGKLYRSIGMIVEKVNNDKQIVIGARTKGQFKGYHAHLLEDGTKERSYITKKGNRKSVGKVKGIKFWFKTFEENDNLYIQNLQNNIIKEMEKLLKKYNK